MKRREFLKSSAAAALGLGAGTLPIRAAGNLEKDVLELRTYHFAEEEKRLAFERFLARAAVPALNRVGVRPVGAWKLLKEDNPKLAEAPLDIYALLPHKSMESVLTLIDRLAEDPWFVSEAESIIAAPPSDPAYTRFESALLLAFDGFPRVQVPTLSGSRLAQLRIYESPTDERALAKIDMFNNGGELDIFKKTGLTPVFFGQRLIGSGMPNLTYMLSFPDKAAMQKAWRAFGRHPDWRRLSKDPQYADTVSHITNLVLRPCAGSQI